MPLLCLLWLSIASLLPAQKPLDISVQFPTGRLLPTAAEAPPPAEVIQPGESITALIVIEGRSEKSISFDFSVSVNSTASIMPGLSAVPPFEPERKEDGKLIWCPGALSIGQNALIQFAVDAPAEPGDYDIRLEALTDSGESIYSRNLIIRVASEASQKSNVKIEEIIFPAGRKWHTVPFVIPQLRNPLLQTFCATQTGQVRP